MRMLGFQRDYPSIAEINRHKQRVLGSCVRLLEAVLLAQVDILEKLEFS